MKVLFWSMFLAVIALIGFSVWMLYGHAHSSGQTLLVARASPPPSHVPDDSCIADGTIKTSLGPYKRTRYTFCLQLTSSTVLFDNRRTLSGFGEDGQFEAGEFEVVVKPSAFPVAAPSRCKGVVVRMPWTIYSDSPDAKANVAAKKTLYSQISALKSNPIAHVNVAVELNPYVSALQTEPLKLRFAQCNAFFRDIGGRYIPRVD